MAFCLSLCIGCGYAGARLSELAPQINMTLDQDILTLAPGDTVAIQVALLGEWNQDVTIDNEGKAVFLGVPEPVQVAGLTVHELRQELEQRYGSFLSNPRVGVFVRQYALRQAVVMGEVNSPGPVDIQGGRMTLIEAIGRAGGHRKDSARLKNILLVRWSKDQQKQLAWKIDARPEQWEVSAPVYMQPNDFVYIPNTVIDKVDIWIDKYIRQLIPFPVPTLF